MEPIDCFINFFILLMIYTAQRRERPVAVVRPMRRRLPAPPVGRNVRRRRGPSSPPPDEDTIQIIDDEDDNNIRLVSKIKFFIIYIKVYTFLFISATQSQHLILLTF